MFSELLRPPIGNVYHPILETEEAAFSIGAKTILEPVSLKVTPGTVMGVVGQNGSGKSTLLKILAGQLQPTAGAALLDGRPISRWGERAFARKVAYLPQYLANGVGLTVRELVSLGRYPWHGALGRFSDADSEIVDDALAMTALTEFAGRSLETLSGGECQRAWIAMLIAQDARIVLLDEPISALDVAHQVAVLRLIGQLSRDRSVTAVVVLHEINLAARFCDEILALKAGRLVSRCTSGEMMAPDALEKIFDVPMGVFKDSDSTHSIAYVRT